MEEGRIFAAVGLFLGHSPVSAVLNLVSKQVSKTVRDILTRSMSGSVDKHDAMHTLAWKAQSHAVKRKYVPAVET